MSLDRRWRLPLVVVHAGAGFGKSTLLAQAMRENQLEPKGRDVWVSLEPADSAAAVLADRLRAALDPTFEADVEPNVATLARALAAQAPTHVAVMIDDVHRLDSGSSGERLLGQLLRSLPANAHMVLASRRPPPVPLSRLQAQGRVLVVGGDELRFTESEVGAFAGRTDMDLTRFGGWPALVRLGSEVGAATPADFVFEEVLDGLAADARRGLEVAALIDGASEGLIEEIVGVAGAADVVASVPLVATNADGEVRPHHLWREFLIPALGRDAVAALLSDAATALHQRGQHGRAFELLAEAGDWERALPVLFAACNDQRQPPWRGQLERWRESIPPTLAERPEAKYVSAMLLREERPWDPETIDLLGQVLDAFEKHGDRRSLITAGLRSLLTHYFRCDPDGFEQHVFRLARRPDMERTLDDVLSRTPATAAQIAFLRGDVGAAEVALARVDPADLEPRMRFFPSLVAADLAMMRGDVDRALVALDAAAGWAADCDGAGGTLESRARPEVLRRLQGIVDLQTATDMVAWISIYTAPEQLEMIGWSALLSVHAGDLARAEELIARARAANFDSRDLPRVSSVVAVAEASLRAATGDLDGAAAMLATCLRDGKVAPAGESSAMFWQPALAALADPAIEDQLRSHLTGGDGLRALELGAAAREARAGRSFDVSVLDRPPEWLMGRLPLPLLVELACSVVSVGSASGDSLLSHAVAVRPAEVREALRRVADGGEPAGEAALEILAGLPIPPDQPLRLELLGPTRLLSGGSEVEHPDWRRERARSLLALLVLQGEQPRERAAAILWPDADPSRASANLRLTLHYLQSALEPTRAKGDASYFLDTRGTTIRLRGFDRLTVDVWDFERFLDEAESARRSAAITSSLFSFEQALALWRGDQLSDVLDQEWAEVSRHRLQMRFLDAGVRCGSLQLADDRPEDALATALRVLEMEPWSEAAHRIAISARLDLGDRAGALRQIESCRQMLAELGVDPEGETLMLERLARRTDPTDD